jgi:hypothetical protein
MDQAAARFKDQLFNSPNEIRFMDQLAEWNRQHLDARYASAQLYSPKSKRLRVVSQREFAPALIGQFHDMPSHRERCVPAPRACECLSWSLT